MTDLQRALYQFAQENRVYSLLHTDRQALREGQKMVQEARAGLRALGDEAAGLGEKMEDGMRSFWRDWPSGWSWGGGRFCVTPGPTAERAAQCAAPTERLGNFRWPPSSASLRSAPSPLEGEGFRAATWGRPYGR